MARVDGSNGRVYEFYHGTSWGNAQQIAREGFKVSPNGLLGCGVYVGREGKAEGFAENCDRHGGSAGGRVKCRIFTSNPKFTRHEDPEGTWRHQGHDAVRADRTSMSQQMEWCVRDPSQIKMIGIERIPCGGRAPVSDCDSYTDRDEPASPFPSASSSAMTPMTQTFSERVISSREPSILSGWEHSIYAHAGTPYANERYSYLGKDEASGEPQWLDYGPKGSSAGPGFADSDDDDECGCGGQCAQDCFSVPSVFLDDGLEEEREGDGNDDKDGGGRDDDDEREDEDDNDHGNADDDDDDCGDAFGDDDDDVGDDDGDRDDGGGYSDGGGGYSDGGGGYSDGGYYSD